jgi:hypothetical protein
MSDPTSGDAQTWGAMGIWALLFVALYCAVCETINTLTAHGIRKDLDEHTERVDQQIDAINKRLELIGAPAAHTPTRDVTILTGQVIDPTAATTVHEAVKATDQAVEGLEQMAAAIKGQPDDVQPMIVLPPAPKPSGSHRWEPTMDMPTPEQHKDPTRPDFARLTNVPEAEKDALTPAFRQAGDDPTPTVTIPAQAPKPPRGRHRAEP